MIKRITSKTANEWRALAGNLPVKEIAERYGVHTGTVYYHINRKHAAIRREQWRVCTARRRAERRAAA